MKIYYNPKLKELARQMRNNPTYAEKSLWYALKEDQLSGYDFHRQKPIGDFIFDFYSFDLKLIIEVDGYTHEFVRVKENDLRKDEFVNEIGFNILRFTDDEVLGNPNKVVKKIEEYIEWFEKNQIK